MNLRKRNLVLLAVIFSLLPLAMAQAPTFEQEKAWQYLCDQVKLGPRVPESQAIQKTRSLILDTLSHCGFTTHVQSFRAYAPLLGREAEGINIIGLKPGSRKQTPLVISAHYDTRPRADMDSQPQRRVLPIPGANDGASGVAVLLAIAESLKMTTPPQSVALVFFDLEDSGEPSDVSGYCLGSRFMASNLPAPIAEFELGINLDMVGKKDLRLLQEMYSLRAAPAEVNQLWEIGAQVAPKAFVKRQGVAVYDDHIPFLERGKKFINVIDFDYAQWHTVDDSIEQCSSESLKAVGETILQFLFR
jgi:Zn-dependent M28 family amino/carboxypeptidase